jgi:hypothetical protein
LSSSPGPVHPVDLIPLSPPGLTSERVPGKVLNSLFIEAILDLISSALELSFAIDEYSSLMICCSSAFVI